MREHAAREVAERIAAPLSPEQQHALAVLTGGWQTSKETAYVEATRARQRTDWHIAHQDLNPNQQDPGSFALFAQRLAHSRAHTPTTTQQEQPNPTWDPTHDPLNPNDPSPIPWPGLTPGDDFNRER